mgnify:CR=1 FL=1
MKRTFKIVVAVAAITAMALHAMPVVALEYGDQVYYTSSIDLRDAEGNLTGNVINSCDSLTFLNSDGSPNGWSKVKSESGDEGYLYSAYLRPISEKKNEVKQEQAAQKEKPMKVVNTAMWVRHFQSYDGICLDVVYPGDTVTFLGSDGTSNGWSKIKTKNGIEGYVFTQNLEEIFQGEEEQNQEIAENTIPEEEGSIEDSTSVTVELYNTPSGNSWYNIQLAAATLNGYTLYPGETFSWEAVMGGSTEAQGYLLSKGYSGGKVVQTPGGGVCFVSTTLMQGARAYGLDIIECHDHSLPVSYASRGNEAAVSFGSADLKFANNTGYPVQICMSTDSNTGGCICTISAVK